MTKPNFEMFSYPDIRGMSMFSLFSLLYLVVSLLNSRLRVLHLQFLYVSAISESE